MKLLLSPSNPRWTLVLLDLATGEAEHIEALPAQSDYPRAPQDLIDTPHRPFGITWHDGVLYVANRRNLLRFDRELRYLGVHSRALCTNPHQLVAHDGALFVASPRMDGVLRLQADDARAVAFLDPAAAAWRAVPSPVGAELDRHHYNSLVFHGDRLYVLSHNRGEPSEALVLDAQSFAMLGRVGPLGRCAHNLCPEPDGLTTLDTGATRSLIRSDGLRIPLDCPPDHFLRGLAVSEHHYVVATFESRLRLYRSCGGSTILVIDRASRRIVARHFLADIGAVNDMRLLDVFDHAHGVPPFWPAAPPGPSLAPAAMGVEAA